MSREIQRVRKVGQTLVVTIPQSFLNEIKLTKGDKVLIESMPPRKMLVTQETEQMPNTKRAELEIDALEKRKAALDSEANCACEQWNHSDYQDIPDNEADFAVYMALLNRDRSRLDAEIAEKKLALFDLQG